MQVPPDLVDEKVVESILGVGNTETLGFTTELAIYSIKLIRGEKLWDVASRQDIVDVDEELLIDNL